MDQDFPLISIVILNYNGFPYVEACLRSVLKTDYPNLEIIFVDNGSTDGSWELVRNKFGKDSRLKIINNDKNYGYCKGNNIGFRYAKGEYVIFLNNDTEVVPEWLSHLISEMKRDPLIGAAQPKVLKRRGEVLTIDCVGGFLHPLGFVLAPGRGQIDKGQYDKKREVLAAYGAAFTVKRELMDKVGLFDKDYFIFSEEIDLSWRIWLTGYKVIVVPTSVVYHLVSALIDREFEPSYTLYLYVRNYIVTILKNLELMNLVKVSSSYLAFLVLSALKRRDVNLLICMSMAILWILRNLRVVVEKRSWIQKRLRVVRDSVFLKMLHS